MITGESPNCTSTVSPGWVGCGTDGVASSCVGGSGSGIISIASRSLGTSSLRGIRRLDVYLRSCARRRRSWSLSRARSSAPKRSSDAASARITGPLSRTVSSTRSDRADWRGLYSWVTSTSTPCRGRVLRDFAEFFLCVFAESVCYFSVATHYYDLHEGLL